MASCAPRVPSPPSRASARLGRARSDRLQSANRRWEAPAPPSPKQPARPAAQGTEPPGALRSAASSRAERPAACRPQPPRPGGPRPRGRQRSDVRHAKEGPRSSDGRLATARPPFKSSSAWPSERACPSRRQGRRPRRRSSSCNQRTGSGLLPSVDPSSSTKRAKRSISGMRSSIRSRALWSPRPSGPRRRHSA